MVSDNSPSAAGTSSTSAPRLWPRIAPSLWVLACAPIAAGVLASAIIGSDLASREFLRSYRPPNIHEVMLSITAEFAEQSPGTCDVVFFGDSSAGCSIDPIQCERASNFKCVNISGTGVIGIEGYTLLLRRYLEHHSAPRAVVLGMHPRVFGVPDYEIGPKYVRQRFLRCYGDAGVVVTARAMFETASLPGAAKATLKDLVIAAVCNQTGKLRGMSPEQHFEAVVPTVHGNHAWTYHQFESSLRERGGFVAHGTAMSPGDRWPYSVEFPIREENREAMRNLIALTNKYSTLLIIRLTPVLTMPQEPRFDEMRDWLAELERKNANVVVSRPELIEFPPECHMEPMHLNTTGAEKFTAFVAEDVQRILAARRPSLSESADRNE